MLQPDDVRVQLLTNVFSSAGGELVRLLRELEITNKREFIYQKILRLLVELKSASSGWASSYIPQFYREADLKQVQAKGLRVSELNSNPAEELIAKMLKDTDKALVSVQALTKLVQRGEEKAPTRDLKVSIVGKNGRRYQFELVYYVSLIVQNVLAESSIRATLERSREINNDLIQVSSLLSNYENACSLYANKVFSISGKSTIVPAFSSIPKMPFHPFCSLSLELFLDIPEEQDIPRYAFLQGVKDNFARVTRDYKEAENG